MKTLASAVVLAILGILFVLYNPHDGAMVRFGWFLLVVGALIAGVFSYMAFKGGPEVPEPRQGERRKRRR